MNKTLENERLLIEVAERGSELVRVYDKKNDREVLWTADPAFWPKHSPLLFPMIGASYEKKYRVGGKEYDMPNHGFAWTSDFTFVKEDGELAATFASSEESREKYPYDFKVTVGHKLEDNKITVSWKVENTGAGEMLYSIGAHPAFMMPEGMKTSDMYLAFPGKKDLPFYRIAKSGCALKDDVKTLALDEDSCVKITEDFWNEDVYIFDHQELDRVALCHGDKTPYVTIHSKGFPYFGVWTKPQAPFVCLEPWQGRCDRDGYTGELKDKDGIRKLAAGLSEEFSYIIEIA
ncbi:MAG: aldose 1-epimerase family protein [Lachnospiraceae bacterium]|nr:aldose 1-epimerase family protein [Lachnospiraceae bacterium]